MSTPQDFFDRARAYPIEGLTARLGINNLKRVGSHERVGPCPICRDGVDRFSINTDKNVWNCRRCDKGGSTVDLVKQLDGCSDREAAEAVLGEKLVNGNGGGRMYQQQTYTGASTNGSAGDKSDWVYRDKDGNPYHRVARVTKDGKKSYHQSHWDGLAWIKGKPKGPVIPYRLPELLALDPEEPIILTEGEKCADAVYEKLGLFATTAPGGALNWKPELNIWFKDRYISILPDNDDPGRKHARMVANSLHRIAKAVKIVELPGLKPKEDVYDWIKAGGTKAAFTALEDSAKPFVKDEDLQWPDACKRDPKGNIIAEVYNVIEMLRSNFSDHYSYNEMQCEVINNNTKKTLTDNDTVCMQAKLQFLDMKKISRGSVQDAIVNVAHDRSFHPLRDRYNALRWDEVPILDLVFLRGFGAEDNEYNRLAGRFFLMQMVSRIMRPGRKAQYVPVLEGPQGILKSTACAILAGGDEYFGDDLPPLENKDSKSYLRGKVLIEIQEMHTFTRAEVNELKSFITRDKENYRPSYGRNEVTEPRQCVFMGTTNQEFYLKDETGGRRFWPIKCGTIDIEWIKGNWDRLFAEAVHRFRAGEQYWPDPDTERRLMKPEQDARFEEHPWETKIAEFLQGKLDVNVNEVGLHLGIMTSSMDRPKQMAIAGSLKRLGWESYRKSSTERRWRQVRR